MSPGPELNLTYMVSLSYVTYDPIAKATLENSNYRALASALSADHALADVYLGLGYYATDGLPKVIVNVRSSITRAQKILVDGHVGLLATSAIPTELVEDDRDNPLIPQEPRIPAL